MATDKIIINESELTEADLMALREMSEDYYEQGTDEWHQERLGNATSSRFFDIVDWTNGSKYTESKPKASYYRYRNELLTERLTGRVKRFSNKYMDWGKDHEEDAAAEYERMTGNEVKECGFVKHAELRAGASLDREVDSDGSIEIKCPNTDTMIDYVLNDGPPPNYYTQMQGQMWITGRQWCDFVVYDTYLQKAFVKRVGRDDEYINNILEPRIRQFLKEVDECEEKLRAQGYVAPEYQ